MSSVLKRSGVLWTVALVVTLASAYYQRTTGPTYPLKGAVSLGGETIRYRLERSHGGATDQLVRVQVPGAAVSGEVRWRRYPTNDPWNRLGMRREGEMLVAALPNQPAAGKLEYQVALARGNDTAVFPQQPAVTRFKGEVSPWVLAPHVLAMFAFMLLSTRAGLAALSGADVARLTRWAFWMLMIGGFVLGPLMQKQAFNEWWAGVPYGWDLTDNKTLLAAVFWVIAFWQVGRGAGRGRAAVVVAALATLVVFAIPHSAWGSEINWQTRR